MPVLSRISGWSCGDSLKTRSAETGSRFLFPWICLLIQTSAGCNGPWFEGNTRFGEFYKSSRNMSNLLSSQACEPSWNGMSLRICLCFQLKSILLYRFYHFAYFWVSETLSTNCVYALRAWLSFCPGKKLKAGYQGLGLLIVGITKMDLTLTTSALHVSTPHRAKILSKSYWILIKE